MIKEIRLENFQGHVSTLLKLAPGVNVITGASNTGKSSIIRAIWWLSRSRPSGAGDNYRHHDAPKGTPTAVSFELDNGRITRFKKGPKNGYIVNGEELVAIRTDVPDEVASLLRFSDHNLQLQHPPHNYFLVANSPGEVAQKLNDVAGLDMIDTCLKNANLLISRNQQDTGTSETRISELNEEISQFDDIADRDEAVEKLEKLDKKICQLNDDIKFKAVLILQIQKATFDREKITEFLKIENRAKPLFELEEKITITENEIGFLENVIETGTRLRREREALDAKIKDLEKEFHRQLKDSGVCPLCGQKIGD